MPFAVRFSTDEAMSAGMSEDGHFAAGFEQIYNSGGVDDYSLLTGKPQINSVELVGNKELQEIGVDTLTNVDIENILNNFA